MAQLPSPWASIQPTGPLRSLDIPADLIAAMK